MLGQHDIYCLIGLDHTVDQSRRLGKHARACLDLQFVALCGELHGSDVCAVGLQRMARATERADIAAGGTLPQVLQQSWRTLQVQADTLSYDVRAALAL